MEEHIMNEKLFLTVTDIQQIMSISRSKAYEIISQLNKELESDGYITVRGKVSRKYFETKVYGVA